MSKIVNVLMFVAVMTDGRNLFKNILNIEDDSLQDRAGEIGGKRLLRSPEFPEPLENAKK